jgi:hypothetical protein
MTTLAYQLSQMRNGTELAEVMNVEFALMSFSPFHLSNTTGWAGMGTKWTLMLTLKVGPVTLATTRF